MAGTTIYVFWKSKDSVAQGGFSIDPAKPLTELQPTIVAKAGTDGYPVIGNTLELFVVTKTGFGELKKSLGELMQLYTEPTIVSIFNVADGSKYLLVDTSFEEQAAPATAIKLLRGSTESTAFELTPLSTGKDFKDAVDKAAPGTRRARIHDASAVRSSAFRS